METSLIDIDELLRGLKSTLPPTCETTSCWGALLTGGAQCTPGFELGKLHFKNKYCDNCRESILVPIEQIRALTPELMAGVSNRRSEGFWNVAPASMGGGMYRIVNNTATCTGPWLAIFQNVPPPLSWLPIPQQWMVGSTHVRLCVAKGTLVPAASLRSGHPQSSSKRRKLDGAPIGDHGSPADPPASPVPPCWSAGSGDQPSPACSSSTAWQVYPSADDATDTLLDDTPVYASPVVAFGATLDSAAAAEAEAAAEAAAARAESTAAWSTHHQLDLAGLGATASSPAIPAAVTVTSPCMYMLEGRAAVPPLMRAGPDMDDSATSSASSFVVSSRVSSRPSSVPGGSSLRSWTKDSNEPAPSGRLQVSGLHAAHAQAASAASAMLEEGRLSEEQREIIAAQLQQTLQMQAQLEEWSLAHGRLEGIVDSSPSSVHREATSGGAEGGARAPSTGVDEARSVSPWHPRAGSDRQSASDSGRQSASDSDRRSTSDSDRRTASHSHSSAVRRPFVLERAKTQGFPTKGREEMTRPKPKLNRGRTESAILDAEERINRLRSGLHNMLIGRPWRGRAVRPAPSLATTIKVAYHRDGHRVQPTTPP